MSDQTRKSFSREVWDDAWGASGPVVAMAARAVILSDIAVVCAVLNLIRVLLLHRAPR